MRRIARYDRLKALVLILLAIFFAEKLVSGRLYYYIGPRFGWLSVVAVGLFIILAGGYNPPKRAEGEHEPAEHPDHTDDHEHHDHDHGKPTLWPIGVVALPLILGVLVPARPLGASAVSVSNRGVSTDFVASAESSESTLSVVASERNVLDWVQAFAANPDPASLAGQQADVVGFVYRDIRFANDQFMVARFTITCCVADASAIGLLVQADDASQFASDSWVRVAGTFGEGQLDGEALPVLLADQITPVQPPEQPYLYP
ncbi:MAG: TIGR03943 family protein [Chloroflexota bacterium]